ncbi:MAG: dockerin type I domain-containing protein [Candidatus Doudnabacteria bacterium]|nr:dockerin type I domain-containing protein [Candidatus Doudnabacteria bacterium]
MLKKYLLLMPAFVLAVAFILPSAAKALTYQELISGESAAAQGGRVLGAVTPSPDINNDGVVNSIDAAILISHMGQNYVPADLNGDGVVDSKDLDILSSWWFASK